MGQVFEAVQPALDRRKVAVKIIHPGFDDDDRHERFERERMALAKLHQSGYSFHHEDTKADGNTVTWFSFVSSCFRGKRVRREP